MLCITVKKEVIREIVLFLRDDKQLDFNFLTTLCGMHYPEKELLGVVYHLHSFVNNHRIRIKTSVAISDPRIPSITAVWPSANWQERETYDFFGILFEGHPNLKRILNVDDMTEFPLRKDFPLAGLPADLPATAIEAGQVQTASMNGGPFVTAPGARTSARREPRQSDTALERQDNKGVN